MVRLILAMIHFSGNNFNNYFSSPCNKLSGKSKLSKEAYPGSAFWSVQSILGMVNIRARQPRGIPTMVAGHKGIGLFTTWPQTRKQSSTVKAEESITFKDPPSGLLQPTPASSHIFNQWSLICGVRPLSHGSLKTSYIFTLWCISAAKLQL